MDAWAGSRCAARHLREYRPPPLRGSRPVALPPPGRVALRINPCVQGDLDRLDVAGGEQVVDQRTAATNVRGVAVHLGQHDPRAVVRPPQVRRRVPAARFEAAGCVERPPETGSSCARRPPPAASSRGEHPELPLRPGIARSPRRWRGPHTWSRAPDSRRRRCPPRGRTMRPAESWYEVQERLPAHRRSRPRPKAPGARPSEPTSGITTRRGRIGGSRFRRRPGADGRR